MLTEKNIPHLLFLDNPQTLFRVADQKKAVRRAKVLDMAPVSRRVKKAYQRISQFGRVKDGLKEQPSRLSGPEDQGAADVNALPVEVLVDLEKEKTVEQEQK